MRIAQLVLAPVVRADVELVEELDATARGSGGTTTATVPLMRRCVGRVDMGRRVSRARSARHADGRNSAAPSLITAI